MIGKITYAEVGNDVVNVVVEYYYEKSEEYYDKYTAVVDDYPITKEGEIPTTHIEEKPFKTLPITIRLSTTEEELTSIIREKGQALNRASKRLPYVSTLLGNTIKV
jgi:hypothetical protein